MTTYYKAVRPDGTDFWTGKVKWLPSRPTKTGQFRNRVIEHPTSLYAIQGVHRTSLAASDDPTDLPGAPNDARAMRLAVVEPVEGHPPVRCDCGCAHKWQAIAWRVVREIPTHVRYGPQGVHVVALIEQLSALTPARARQIAAARGAARYAARDAAWDAAGGAAWGAAGGAAGALVVRDLISAEDYDTLTYPLRKAGVVVHPDDPDVDE